MEGKPSGALIFVVATLFAVVIISSTITAGSQFFVKELGEFTVKLIWFDRNRF